MIIMFKIKFNCNWTNDKSLYDRVISNYIGYEIPQITYKDDYTHLVIFNKITCEQKCSIKNTFGFIMEPSWSNFWDHNLGNYCSKVFFHDLNLLDDDIRNKSVYFEYPSCLMYHMLYNNNVNYFLNTKFKKTNLLSFVTSFTPTNNNYLYDKRTNLAIELLGTNLDFHIYGNNWPILDQRIKGPIQDKKDALIDYKYSIAIENSREKNYVTEKFVDCVLCDTIPIYYGSPNIHDIYDPQEFISLQEISVKAVFDALKIQKQFNLDKLKQTYLSKYNIFNIIKNLI
jgi:hypothetical protein